MTAAFFIGLLLGGGYIWYKGLYLTQPWPNIVAIFAVSTLAAVVVYFAIKFLMGVSTLVFKLLIIAGVLYACYYGGKKAVILINKEDAVQKQAVLFKE